MSVSEQWKQRMSGVGDIPGVGESKKCEEEVQEQSCQRCSHIAYAVPYADICLLFCNRNFKKSGPHVVFDISSLKHHFPDDSKIINYGRIVLPLGL